MGTHKDQVKKTKPDSPTVGRWLKWAKERYLPARSKQPYETQLGYDTSVSNHYSFCETVTAGPSTPWHIRPLTEVGRKLGGGADTPALCGRQVAWDLEVEITKHHLEHCCQKCRAAYEK